MKYILALCILLGASISVYATDITITATTMPNVTASNLPSTVALTSISVTNGSPTVTCSACFRPQWVGLGGFTIAISGVNYTVSYVTSTSSLTLTGNYAGSTSAVATISWYGYVELRFYANAAFQPLGAAYIVQPGTPGSSAWYKRVAASVLNVAGVNTMYIPELTLAATTDSPGPTNQARYVAGFYRPDGSLVSYYACFTNFAVPATTPTTWTALCAYNSPAAIVPPTNEAYTKAQIDARFPSCTSGQMLYYAATGNAQACLTVGSGLTISSGTISSAAGSNIRQAINAKVDYSCSGDGVTNDTTCVNNAYAAAVSTGRPLYFPAGTYLFDSLTIATNSVRIMGDGRNKTVLKSRTNGSLITLDNTATYTHSITIEDMTLEGYGSGASNHGIESTGSLEPWNMVFRNLEFISFGGSSVYFPQQTFSTLFEMVEADGTAGAGHVFDIFGSNTLTFLNTYVHIVPTGKAAYRVHAGQAAFISANGIDGGATADWGVFGNEIADGDPSDNYFFGTFLNCNVEAFTNRGMYFKTGSFGSFQNVKWLSATSGTVIAIKYNFLDNNQKGIFDAASNIELQGSAAWSLGYAVHSNGSPFLQIGNQEVTEYYDTNVGAALTLPAQTVQLIAGTTDTAIHFNRARTPVLELGVQSTTTGQAVFRNATNGNSLTLQAGATGSNLTFTLPTADGSSGQCVSTNGSGVLSFTACGGISGSGAGAGYVTIWNGTSAVTSDSSLFFDTSNNRLGVGTITPTYPIEASGTSGSTVAAVSTTGTIVSAIQASSASSAAIVGALSGHPLQIYAGGAERVRITATGLVGVNNTSPTSRLDVEDLSASVVPFSVRGNVGTSAANLFEIIGDAANIFIFDSEGRLQYTAPNLNTSTSGFITIQTGDSVGATSTDLSGVIFDLGGTRTWANTPPSGSQREMVIYAPVYEASGAGGTIARASTFAVDGPPSASTGVTITNGYAIEASSGNVKIGSSSTASELHFYEPSGSGTNFIAFKAQAMTANLTYTWPSAYSSGTQCLADNGSGTLSWAACSGGGSASLTATYVGYGSGADVLTGEAAFNYNATTNTLDLDHATITQSDTTIVPFTLQAAAASTAELAQIKDSGGTVRGGYATSGAFFFRGFTVAPTNALANDGKLFYDTTGGVLNQQLTLSKNTGQYNAIVVANQASFTSTRLVRWSNAASTAWEVDDISGATSDGTNVTFGSTNLRATSPRITTGIQDANGNELFLFTATGSAVNELTYANAATGGNPTFTASGGDTNIGINFTAKAAEAVSVRGNSTQAGEFRLYEDTDDGTSYVALKAGALAGNVTWTLPTADSSGSQCLASNGSGVLSWTACSGGSASLTATYVGYGDGSNVLTGENAFTYDATNNILSFVKWSGAGLDIDTDLNDTAALVDGSFSIIKNDNNVRIFHGVYVAPILNTGASNLNTTLNVISVDTVNSALTGLTTNLLNLAYGGTTVFTVTSTGAMTLADGVKQTFNPNATTAGINVGSVAGDPSAPANGDLWYDSTANELTARINGATVALGAGGGLTVGTTAIASGTAGRILYETAGNVLGEIAGSAVDANGAIVLDATDRTSGVASYFTIKTPADTTLTASTESVGIYFGGDGAGSTVTRQWSTGALTAQREYVFVAPTYAFAGASTLTTASTVSITGPPIAGTNATLTNRIGLNLDAASGVTVPSAAALAIGNNLASSGLVAVTGLIRLGPPTSNTIFTIDYARDALSNNILGIGRTQTGVGQTRVELLTGASASNAASLVLYSASYSAFSSTQQGAVFLRTLTSTSGSGKVGFLVQDESGGRFGVVGNGVIIGTGRGNATSSNTANAELDVVSGSASRVGLRVDSASSPSVDIVSFTNNASQRWGLNSSTTSTNATVTDVNGGTQVRGTLTENITLNTGGTTTDSTIDLPANSIILSVTARVTTTITTATDWTVGDATTADRFSDANSTLTAGTTSVGINQWKADRTTAGQGPYQASTAKVRITTTGTPGAGAIRITIHYITLTAPTS